MKKKHIRKLKSKIKVLEATSSIEARVSALEKNLKCTVTTSGCTTEYDFASFVRKTLSELSDLRKVSNDLQKQINELKTKK